MCCAMLILKSTQALFKFCFLTNSQCDYTKVLKFIMAVILKKWEEPGLLCFQHFLFPSSMRKNLCFLVFPFWFFFFFFFSNKGFPEIIKVKWAKCLDLIKSNLSHAHLPILFNVIQYNVKWLRIANIITRKEQNIDSASIIAITRVYRS